ncbi:MAG: hypothetical protein R3C14_30170 [Caldilineaceae bacterium]
MTYSDFSLETVNMSLGLAIQRATLFTNVTPVAAPTWLQDVLTTTKQMALVSEKARSEFIVAPILLSVRQLSGDRITIYSGQRLDVDNEKGLMGECDFILADTPPLPIVQAPIVTLVEAKKNDIESGLGQCAAQMYAADLFNQKKGHPRAALFGCVTTGEVWQFLKLADAVLYIDSNRYYIDQVEIILGVLAHIVAFYLAPTGERATDE